MLGFIESGLSGMVGTTALMAVIGGVATVGAPLMIAGALIGVSAWLWRAE